MKVTIYSWFTAAMRREAAADAATRYPCGCARGEGDPDKCPECHPWTSEWTHRYRRVSDPSVRARIIETWERGDVVVELEGLGQYRVGASSLVPIDECSCGWHDYGTGETGPQPERDDDPNCPVHSRTVLVHLNVSVPYEPGEPEPTQADADRIGEAIAAAVECCQSDEQSMLLDPMVVEVALAEAVS